MKREDDLRAQMSKQESSHKDEVANLESAVKAAKKVAVQQVSEISNRVKNALEEAEAVKVTAQSRSVRYYHLTC